MSSNSSYKKEKQPGLGCLTSIVCLFTEIVAIIPCAYLLDWVDDIFSSDIMMCAVFIIYYILVNLGLGYLMYVIPEKMAKDYEKLGFAADDREKYLEKEPFEKIPHFGKLFGYDQLEKIIDGYNFSPYVDKKGQQSENISLSEDGKWVQILGGYIPVDLLCGYNKDSNYLYTIDYAIIQLPSRARKDKIKAELTSFFESRGMYYKSLPDLSPASFEELVGQNVAFEKTDWSRVRYQWEKSLISNKQSFKALGLVRFNPRSINNEGGRDFFERVLSESELESAAKAINRKVESLTDFLNFDKFKNKYSVCNGIELIKLVNDSKKKDGLDFLFDCLRDADEACFIPAAELLRTFPADDVFKKMEKNVRRAYENRDANRLAGILYLSKLMGHETEYIRKKKEEIRKGKEEELQKTIESVYDTRKYVMYMLEE